MNTRHPLCLAVGLAAAPFALPALAQDAAPARPGTGLTELSDAELGDMRGRYTVGDNAVAWFGVTMVSSWQAQNGQVLQSRLNIGLDVRTPDAPKLVFQPHVSITAADAPLPAPDGERGIDAAGLGNVSGLVQSVQVAGDANRASNVARVNLRSGSGDDGSGTVEPVATQVATAHAPGMQASALLERNAARVLLQIDGHGAVEQWVGRSGLGQTIQLSGDAHVASNWMEVDLVRGVSSSRAPLGQNVAQAIALSRGIAIGY